MKETQLQEQSTQLQAHLIELAHDALIVRDQAGVIVSWNRGAEELYGWSPNEAVGKNLQVLLKTVFPKPSEQISPSSPNKERALRKPKRSM